MNWVYFSVFIPNIKGDEVSTLNRFLNKYNEYELVTVDNGIAYFKRPLEDFELMKNKSGMKIPKNTLEG